MNLTITQLVSSIKMILDSQPNLQNISVVGEISNLVKHRSGHWYFSLKDDKSRINCVMFQSYNKMVKFQVKDGQQVVVRAVTTVYLGSGQLQLVCSTMALDGEGALYQAYLELRDKLHKEGLFDPVYKKPIKRYPSSIGVIAGSQSAALADVLKTLKERWPMANVSVYESLVQGERASLDLISKLEIADKDNHDTILLVRGGGSLEDLWAFNNEQLARFIFAMKTPIITGVGHEIDVTLVDYVADLRALTPTAAAQAATPNQNEVITDLESLDKQLKDRIGLKLKLQQNHLNQLLSHRYFQMPSLLIHYQSQKLRDLDSSLSRYSSQFSKMAFKIEQDVTSMKTRLDKKVQQQVHLLERKRSQFINLQAQLVKSNRQRLNILITQLDERSPLKLMQKGYVTTTHNQKRLISIKQISKNSEVIIQYVDGRLTTKVIEIERQ